jgi:ER-bound oxygenase mpaB/B'/Rubber oxygenase, catalytic domain
MPLLPRPVPSRFQPTPALTTSVAQHRIEALSQFLLVGDALADAAVESLTGFGRAHQHTLIDAALLPPGARDAPGSPTVPAALVHLVESAANYPFWADLQRANQGGKAILKTGAAGGLVLAFGSLIRGYCSPCGNKPLTFTGQLETAGPRRLAETSRFVEAVCLEDGLLPYAPGFVATLKVRLMHAQVRKALRNDARWRSQDWGEPINQYDMAGTALLFSWVLIDGLNKLGVQLTLSEIEDVLAQWRLVGHLMGVVPELLCATAQEADLLWRCIESSQALPDADSERLAKALIEGPERRSTSPTQRRRLSRWTQFGFGLSRHLLTDRYADAMHYPPAKWTNALPLAQRLVRVSHAAMKVIPGSDASMLNFGRAYWRKSIALGLNGAENLFQLPQL